MSIDQKTTFFFFAIENSSLKKANSYSFKQLINRSPLNLLHISSINQLLIEIVPSL